MTDAPPRRRILSDVLFSLALCAWVGGRAALGAFAARLVFGTLPRAMAAPTMNQIFRQFDWVIWSALVLIVVALLLRVAAPLDRWLFGAGGLLLVLGLGDVLYTSPHITALWEAGQSGSPEFATIHHLSERSAHLELALAIVVFVLLARRRTQPG